MSAAEFREYVTQKLLPKTKKPIEKLVEEAFDFAQCHGLVVRTNEHPNKSDICQIIPMTLFPTPFPAKLFKQAMEVQDAMCELYFKIAWDYEFLIEAHKDVIKTDEFTRNLVEIFQKVWNEGISQTKSLLYQRADYMADASINPSEGELKQIEVNNACASMSSFCHPLTLWHQKIISDFEGSNSSDDEVYGGKVPNNNDALQNLSEGIYISWQSMNDPNGIVLMIVEDVNIMQLDQKYLEYRVSEISGRKVKFIRATISECVWRLSLNKKTKTLILDEKIRVNLVYFRVGLFPTHYPTEASWNARLLIERSNAIKCPWIGLQLANTKKVQQILTQKGKVEKYFPENPEIVKKIRDTFTKIWGLDSDGEETKKIIQEAIENPNNYVLKPQFDGGHGVCFDEEMVSKLKNMSRDERSAYILMEKLQPLVFENVMIRAFKHPINGEVVSELGIYGYAFGNSTNIERQCSHGHIMRTKNPKINDSSVLSGSAVIDMPYLY